MTNVAAVGPLGSARPLRSLHRGGLARSISLTIASGLTACGLLLFAEDAWIAVKARVAAVLIDRAFAAHLRDGLPHRPWPWADLHPVASLEIERLGVRRVVLSGASGSSLAFGIGHVDGTAPPGSDGHAVLAGHRDTWARFLEELRPGDRIRLRTRSGSKSYVVSGAGVVHESKTEILDPGRSNRLTLLTCYPFGALGRGPLRYVVECGALFTATSRSASMSCPRNELSAMRGAVHDTRVDRRGEILTRRRATRTGSGALKWD